MKIVILKQEHRFFIATTENSVQFLFNLCIICTQSVNVFESAKDYKENQEKIFGIPIQTVWRGKLVLFIVKALLSMFSSFKSLSDNITLESKIKFKRDPDCRLMFIKLFNFSLLVISLAGNISVAYMSDAIGLVYDIMTWNHIRKQKCKICIVSVH